MDQNDETSDAGAGLPIQFPCLLWEPSLDAVVLATDMGVGTVLKSGSSTVLKVGMVVPYAANRWSVTGEEWDFILPPPDLEVRLKNVPGVANRPAKLGIEIRHGGQII
jgi:hypothetical protein